MIDVEHSNANYYYHFDGLGSVIALTNSSGATAVLYEYSVYGQVAASDPNHPNRFLFTGREFDRETGLYYYRARYYNPEIGRFLQTDRIGYRNGMNIYAYCGNDPITYVDPSGLAWEDPLVRIVFFDGSETNDAGEKYQAREAEDGFWDIRIDMGSGAAKAHGYSSTLEYLQVIFKGLKSIIWQNIPIDEKTGLKIYDIDTQIKIQGVWFLDHGWQYGDHVAPGDPEFQNTLGALKESLKNNNGAGAPIHLRGCKSGVDLGDNWGPEIETVATFTGHPVTGALGDVIDYGYDYPNGADYHCEEGYTEVHPVLDDNGNVTDVWYGPYYYHKSVQIADPLKPGEYTYVYQQDDHVY